MSNGLHGFKGEISEYDLETFRWKGTWSTNTYYQIDDRVYYQGSSYVAVKNSQNQVPFNSVLNSVFWQYISVKGDTGITGAAGSNGVNGVAGAGVRYLFSSSTSSGPTSGQIRLNNATYSSVTQIYLHETDRNSTNVASALGQISDGSVLVLFDDLDSSKIAFFTLTSQVDNGTDRTFNTSYLAHSGSFSNGANTSLGFAIKGNTGSTGPTGSTGSAGQAGFGIRFTYNTTTSGPPSTGQIRFNNSTIASVTQLFVHETDRNSAGISTVLSNIPDGSALIVFDESNSANYAFFSLTSQTDNGTDRTFAVTYLGNNGTFSNGSSVSLGFAQRGSAGATGSTGATGSVSSASGIVLTDSAAPTTSGTQTAIYSASGVPSVRLISNGATRTIALQGNSVNFDGNSLLATSASAPTTGASQVAFFNNSGVPSVRLASSGATQAIAVLSKQQAYTASQTVTPSTLTDGANIAVNAALSNSYRVTLAGNRTLDNPTNLSDGQTLIFFLKQDATGSRTLAYGSKYKFAGGTTPALSTAASKRDILTCSYDLTEDILFCNLQKDF